MYRHGRAAVATASRLRPAAPLRAWAPLELSGTGPDAPRCRYRARAQDLEITRGPIWALPLLPPPTRGMPPGPTSAPSNTSNARNPSCPRALSPLEGLEGAITTVDGHREDDIVVRDGPAPSSLLFLLLLRPLPNPLLASPAPSPPPPTPPPSAQLPPPSQGGSPPPSMEEHLAVMHQKLQDELPNFFLRIPDYGIYSPDVEFINHLLHLHTRGLPMYQVAVALCRAAAWVYFASLRLELLALTRHPEDWSIRARWRLTGLPLHLCLLRFYRRDKGHLLRSFDAFSTFFLNSQGLIRCHRVDKLMPASTPVPEAKKLLVAAAAMAATLSEPGAVFHPLAFRSSATTLGDT